MTSARRGDGRDEYWERLDIHATALAGLVAFAATIGMCVWEWGHGRDGSPYTQLGAASGVAYVVAVAFPQVEELRRDSTVGSPARRAGRTSRHVHWLASLSGRKRISFVP